MTEVDDMMENVKRLSVPVTIAVSAGVARFVFSDQRSFYSFLRGVFIAAFVGLLGGYALQDVHMGEGAANYSSARAG